MREKATEFLKECIADAILELLREKPLNKITADDICKRSGVGRATYFRHFKSKRDAIVFKRSLLWQRYCDRTGIEIRDRFYIDNSERFFRFIYEIRDMTRLLYETGNEFILIDYMKDMAEHTSVDRENMYREKFLIFGLMGMLDTWARSGFEESPEQLSAQLEKILASADKAPV